MRDLDDIDRELLRLLLEDARRPFSDLAERVDLFPASGIGPCRSSRRIGRDTWLHSR
ncbi:MAG: AsnC family transcriptional regulator [Natronomonas sp.]